MVVLVAPGDRNVLDRRKQPIDRGGCDHASYPIEVLSVGPDVLPPTPYGGSYNFYYKHTLAFHALLGACRSGPRKGDGASRTLFVQRRAGTPCPVGSFVEAIRRPDTGGRVQDLAIERLTVAQAAARLGVSQDAVRKRIKRGTIEYEQGQDGRLHVYLDPLEVYETRQDRAGDTRTDEIRRRW
jgi:excisionase family DNA binding protein